MYFRARIGVTILTVLLELTWGGCATQEVRPSEQVLPPEAPAYVKVPHPDGMDVGDLLAIFAADNAPAPDSLKNCDEDFKKLREKTTSRDELEEGARELVQSDPVKYHWCYYGKLYSLDTELKNENYIQEKQKKVLDAYVFLTPIARSFMAEFRDSRYLRIAIQRYRHYSEVVFYRRVETTPETTQQFSGIENPWKNYRPPAQKAPAGILEKYGIVKAEDIAKTPAKDQNEAVLPNKDAKTAAPVQAKSASAEIDSTLDVDQTPNEERAPATVDSATKSAVTSAHTPSVAAPAAAQPAAAVPAAAPPAVAQPNTVVPEVGGDGLPEIPDLDSP